MQRLSKTGLVTPDRVPYGTHLCQFYETKEDLLEVLVPYFKEGLAANESCIWITSDLFSVAEAKDALRAAVPELDHYLTTGQMEIIPHEKWYLLGGSFKIDAVLSACCKKAEIALDQGYCGLRATGDAACFQNDHWNDLIAYEEKVQSSIYAQKMIALCSYPLTQCTATQFLQAVNSHDYAIVRRQGGWECIESRGRKQLMDRLLVQKQAIASSLSPLVMMDLAGNLTYANPAALKAWGYESENEGLNRPATEFWDSPEELMKCVESVRAGGSNVCEMVAKRKDGSTFDAEVLGSLTLDDRGQPIGMVASCLDVTARKAAERRLRESEQHYRTLVENIKLGVTLIDRQHKIVAVNGVHAKMVGRPVDECFGQECFRVFEKREAICPHCPGTRAMETGKPEDVELTGVWNHGMACDIRIQAFPVHGSDGCPEGFIEVVEDITDRKQEQDALRRANFCVEQAADCILWIDPAGKIVFANQKACEVLEYSKEELQELTVFDIDPMITREWWRPHWEAIREKKSFIIETCHRTKSGQIFPVEVGVNYMTFEGNDYNCVFARDIRGRKEAEKQLAHFWAIVNSSQDAIYGSTLDGVVTSWNPGAERLYGYAAAEIIGRPISILAPPERSDEITKLLSRARDGERVELDTVRRRKDGTLVNVYLTWSAIKNVDGDVVGAVAIAHDITNRKRAEESIRENEEKLTSIIDNAAENIFTVSLDGVLTLVSPVWTRLLGHDASEVMGQSFEPFIHPDDVAECLAAMKSVLATGEPQRRTYRIRHKDGNWRWHRTAGSLVRDGQGRPAYFVGVAEDVTERRNAEQELRDYASSLEVANRTIQAAQEIAEAAELEVRKGRDLLQAVVDGIGTPITLIDRNYQILLANRTVRELAGGIDPVANSRKCHQISHGQDTPCEGQHDPCPLKMAFESRRPAKVIHRHSDFRGKESTVEVTATPIVDDNNEIRYVIESCYDITELKRVETDLRNAKQAAEAANRAKSEFLANMSHEIRTPMTAILGFTDILLGNVANEETAQSAQIIKRNGENLLKIINDILDLSKIEAGKGSVDLQECSPSQIATDVISLMKVHADAKGLLLTLEVRGAIPEQITTDPIRLRQILVNMIGNAIKFTEVGNVRIVMRLVPISENESKLIFDVIDTGIGMSEEQMGLLFRPFSQADNSSTRRFGGTGLGLAISKRMAEMLGGDIVVQSSLGQGSTFSLSIGTGHLDSVITQEPSKAVAVKERVGKAKAPQKLDCRILLAEDGPDNQRLIAFVLRKAGAEVEIADNGQIALDLALAARQSGTPFDVILTDMQMPVMDGYEATRSLRGAGFRVPIIALTAHAMSEDRQKCMDAGCDGYITKPIDPKKLAGEIKAWVAKERTSIAALPGPT